MTSRRGSIQRASTTTSVIDLLDRTLDGGIVVDAWWRASPGGIDLLGGRLRVVVVAAPREGRRAR